MRRSFALPLLLLLGAWAAGAQVTINTTPAPPNGDVGSTYSFTFTATGGTTPYSWSVPSGVPGLAMNQATGVYSGTPTTAGNFSVLVNVIDSGVGEGSTSDGVFFNININPQLTITTSSPLPEGIAGVAYPGAQFGVTGGQAPYTWSVLPPANTLGLTLSAAGLLSGTPSPAGTPTITVQVRDGTNSAVTANFVLPIAASALNITNIGPMPGADVNRPYSYTFNVSGGVGPFSWSLGSGNFTPGLSLNQATGVLSGTPTSTGTFSYTPTVVDSFGSFFTLPFNRALVLVVGNGPVISSTSPLPPADANSPYSFTFAATGGNGAYTWSAPSGTPAGLTLSAAGVLSGTPTATGTTGIVVQVTDGLGATSNRVFNLTVSQAIVITSLSPLPEGTVGVAGYSFAFAARGGQGEFNWTLVSGSTLGLTFAQNGVLSGTPTTAGASQIVVQAADGIGSARATFTLPIGAAAVTITNVSPMPTGEVTAPYSYTFTATGGIAPYTWSLSSGGPAPGLSLNPQTGVLSGTPTQIGAFSYVPQVRDAFGQVFTLPLNRALALTIINPPAITSTSPLPAGQVGSAYTFTFSATGGQGAYTWSIPSGAPPGLSINAAGILAGTPASAGQTTFQVNVTDALGGSRTTSFALTVNTGLTITNVSPMPAAEVNVAYSYSFTAFGGVAPYTWSLGLSNPAPGLTLNPQTGLLSGTPTLAGNYSYAPQVTDAQGFHFQLPANRALSLNVANGPSISSASLPPGYQGVPYSFTFSATNGLPPYSWGFLSGALPPGVSLDGTGSLRGTPTAAGSFTFTLQLRDAAGSVASGSFSLTINAGVSITTTSPLPGAVVGAPYTAQFAATGGQAPYAWSLASGSLPAGFSLSTSGFLSGTATATGSASFSVRATDNLGVSATGSFSFQITTNLTIQTQLLPNGTVGAAYSAALTSAGGTQPLNWTVASGALPDGLKLDAASGAISGTPTTAGAFTVGIKVTDATPQSATASFTITIAGTLQITTTSLPDGKTTVPYSAQLGASGGVGKLTWSIQSGSLPSGLSLSATGLISGTPGAAGSGSFSALVTDSSTPPQTANRSLSITITLTGTTLSVSPSALPAGTVGSSYSATLAASGGNPPYSWKTGSGSLPGGLSLDGGGTISGTPQAAGTFSFGASVTDAQNNTASGSFTITIAPPQAPGVTVTNLTGTGSPNQQPQFQLTLGQPYPLDLTGQLQLTFTPVPGVDDPMIRFANGTRLLNFTIPAGTTTPVFANGDRPVFLTGTTAGTITLTFSVFQAGGQNVQPVPTPVVVQIPETPPVITSITATRNSTGFQVKITGFTTQRQVTRARFTFAGTNLQTTQVDLTIDTVFGGWFQTPQSATLGTQFSYTQPFNVQGDPQTVTSVTAILTSAAGDSAPATAQLQ